uniref:Intraflagellar transport protein 57 homolog n=1 Tax=Chlamydomonas euryale TaxID=1486919 RepID=A0A7R9VJ89_9CHLO|mmetsp:Transcript_37025/g.109136  ORF Transcript_37025/g.109136 Transcript_37025/m.109136 type:complete len:442 (+) Transcript_37025:210-1535(+)
MAEEQPPPPAGEGEQEAAPRVKASAGRSLEIVTSPEVAMELMVDKLKVMNYERDWCKRKKPHKKPLTRQYFAVPLPSGNQAEQFFHFTSLAAWLLSLAGVEFPTPKEFDDPNKVCSDLLGAVKKLGFAPPSYPAMKLTSGHGKEVCGVLDGLIDYVLEKKKYDYKKPVYLPDGYADGAEEVDDEGAEMEGDIDQFQLPEYVEQEDEEQAYMEMGLMGPPPPGGGTGGAAARSHDAAADMAERQMLTSKVDPHLWKMELERVGPKLRILLNADAKDWRSNLEEVQSSSASIAKAWPESRVVLERMQAELNTSLEKLTTRERYLNEQFERLMQQYRAQKEQLQSVQGTYNKHTEAISDRNNELHRISEQLQEMKGMMEERGSNISDATPVVRIKGAIQKLGHELHEMEVRIGVVSHTLLQLSLKNRRALHAAAAIMSDDDDDV